MGGVLRQLFVIVCGNNARQPVILKGWILCHRQDFTRPRIHCNDNAAGNTIILVVDVIPVIDIPFQDRCSRLLETGIDCQDDIITRGRIDRGFQVSQYLPGYIRFDGALAGFANERVIQG